MRKIVVLAILSLLLAFWTTPVYASGVPSLPHAFYGSVTINGDVAPDNTQVSATVDNGTITPTQNPVTTVGGSYGINSPKLLVQGDSLGGDVTFYVNGIEVEGVTATFKVGGGPTQCNLSVTIAQPPPAPAPPTIKTDVFGQKSSFETNQKGEVQKTITITSPNGKLNLIIPNQY